MTKSHHIKNDSIGVCPSTDPGNSSIDPVIEVNVIDKILFLLKNYLTLKRVNLIGHRKLKVMSWLHFSMVMF